MAQGVITNGASSQCYCGTNHMLDNTGAQPTNNVFQGGLPANLEGDIFSAIEIIVNKLSANLTIADDYSSQVSDNAVQNIAANAAGSDPTSQANNENEGFDDFIISLIEQLLETLEGLMGGGDNNDPTLGNIPSTPVIPVDSSITLDDSIATENAGEIPNFDDMTLAEQKLVMQLYELIEFMNNVGDNLEETSSTRISNLIGYLDQQLDEQWHRNRSDNMILSLIQFLERYRDGF